MLILSQSKGDASSVHARHAACAVVPLCHGTARASLGVIERSASSHCHAAPCSMLFWHAAPNVKVSKGDRTPTSAQPLGAACAGGAHVWSPAARVLAQFALCQIPWLSDRLHRRQRTGSAHLRRPRDALPQLAAVGRQPIASSTCWRGDEQRCWRSCCSWQGRLLGPPTRKRWAPDTRFPISRKPHASHWARARRQGCGVHSRRSRRLRPHSPALFASQEEQQKQQDEQQEMPPPPDVDFDYLVLTTCDPFCLPWRRCQRQGGACSAGAHMLISMLCRWRPLCSTWPPTLCKLDRCTQPTL